MNSEALTALQLSISKWEAIVNNAGYDEGTRNCALCAAFVDKGDGIVDSPTEFDCLGCPVAAVTKAPMCDHTPYQEWAKYQTRHEKRFPSKVFDQGSQELAQAELDFLKSLLPQDTSNAT